MWAITKSYAPPPSYPLKIADWINLENAVPSLQDLLCDECGVTQEEFNVVAAHLDSATPDHIINQAVASFRLSETLHDTARDHASLETAKGTRLWGRFLGLSSDQMESHDRYRGYRQDANGFLLGLDHDVGSATAGAYVGYTRGRTTTRGGSSGEIETDGYHLGLLGRFSPWEDRPEFVLTGEAGYSRYASDAWRDVGLGWIRADFHQRVQSVGVGAEYELKSGDSRLTSFARLRQARLEQDGVEERGSVTRTRVDSVSGDRLSSELGMRFSRTFTTARSTATPYVSASWRHELGDTDFSTRARYALPEGSCLESLPEFRLGSVAWDRNVARLGAGVHASLGLSQGRRLGINTDYKASIGHHGVSHAFSVLLELAF